MAYGDLNNLTRRKVGYQRGLASMIYKFLDKKSFDANTSGRVVLSCKPTSSRRITQVIINCPIIRKFGKRKVYT